MGHPDKLKRSVSLVGYLRNLSTYIPTGIVGAMNIHVHIPIPNGANQRRDVVAAGGRPSIHIGVRQRRLHDIKSIKPPGYCTGEEGYYTAIGAQGSAMQVGARLAENANGIFDVESKFEFGFVFVDPKLGHAAGGGGALGG